MGVDLMPQCTRRLEFDAGHRVVRHESKCRHVHGHRYRADITVSASDLDLLGRVIDFSVIKEKVGRWIDDNLDHCYIMHPKDPIGLQIEKAGSKVYKMPHAISNPTAENIARLIAFEADHLLKDAEVEVIHVRLYETPNCWADWRKTS